jgi:hypothetical protein
MAHFAKLNENNIVTAIYVVNNDVLLDESGNESEQKGINFLKEIYGHEKWKQTSYNKSFRKTYAQIGSEYVENLDVFLPYCGYSSWKFDYNTFQWNPPVPKPEDVDGFSWVWFETNKEWLKVAL